MEKEVEISVEKVYKLPSFTIIEFKQYHLAIAPDIAKWIVLENEAQLQIFNELQNGASIEAVLEKYCDFQDDAISVLTQLEAKGIESTNVKSIFTNTKLHLHITNGCNLHCPHCYMESGIANTNELSTKEIKTLCSDFYKNGGTDVSLTGGEPTVHSDFIEIVEFISNLGMRISIFSNGFLFNEELVCALSKYSIDGVQISVDGYDETSNSLVRGKGVFEKALNAIDLLIKYNIKVKVAVTAPYDIIKNNQEQYISFSKHLLNKYEEDAIEINYSYFFMPGRDLAIEKINETKDSYYKIIDNVVTLIYGDVEENSFVDNLIDDCIFDSCGYGGLSVMANGDFYFCDRISDAGRIGNIREMSFEDIYKLMKSAEEIGKIKNFKPCNDCELKNICGGGCRAEYFREFTIATNIEDLDMDKMAPRKCTNRDKEKIYELMIKTNERFFS